MERQFDILDLSGENYPEWKVDVLTHLKARGLQDTIVEGNTTSLQDKAKAIIFLRGHIHESLKYEFLLVDDPKDIWNNLNARYGGKESILSSKAQNEWIAMRFQDFKSVSDYHCALCRRALRLQFYGHEVSEQAKVEKTLSTMHPSNMKFHEQFRAMGFTKYGDLVSKLAFLETENQLVMRNRT